MKYAFVRDRIHTGDLIAFRKRKGIFPMLTRWITRSPYTHTGVAVWVIGGNLPRLLVAEANAAGSSLSPLSDYIDIDFDVYRCPVNREDVHVSMWRLLGRKVHYGIFDLLRIAANRAVGWPLPKKDDNDMICSAFSAAIYRRAGWRPWSLPSIPAPDDIVSAMRAAPIYEVRSRG